MGANITMFKTKNLVSYIFIFGIVIGVILTGCSSSDQENSTEEESNKSVGNSDYPNKPIDIIVPTGSGGDTDINARVFSKYLEEELGQPVLVSNVNGAGRSEE